MATNQDPPQIEINAFAANNDQTHYGSQEDSRKDINVCYSEGVQSENTPLQHKLRLSMVRSNFKNNRCCLWSSKAVILILAWNLIISFGFGSFFDPSLYIVILKVKFVWMLCGLTYGINALLLVFYPLAGFLADVCWGRYTTVKNGLCYLFWSTVLTSVLVGLALGSTSMIIESYSFVITQAITIAVLSVVFGLPALSGIILLLCSIIAFNANVIQFGIDQLHDAPAESFSLYIHWYVWTNQVGLFLLRLPSAFLSSVGIEGIAYIFSPLWTVFLALIFLGTTLCLEKYKRHWFLIEPGSANPYKLVYKVIKFAKHHTNPIRRSAFTYCEDELPSKFDLGKEKYGGPFTTEQVENVKAFLGIVRVLLTVGPTFLADTAFSEQLPGLVWAPHVGDRDVAVNVTSYAYFYGSGCLTPLLILFLIPLYLCLLRPFIRDYIPGMLKRIGIGMVLCLVSGLCTLVMGAPNHDCATESCTLTSYFNASPHFLLLQYSLNALGYLLIYIASYEFICAQSPHSMKGLLIGTFFSIKGVFQLLGILLLFAPIGADCSVMNHFPVCGFIYYLINIVIALIGLVAFVLVAMRYHYRERDEPDNTYRYAEEYYANAQDETSYGYDNSVDNLNVETIQN